MRLSKSADGVIFAEDSLEDEFNSLSENNPIKKSIRKVINKLKENAFCGERIKKKLIPKEYIKKYNLDNLFWCHLSGAWKLVYSVIADNKEIIALIIGYFSHKDYERRFGY